MDSGVQENVSQIPQQRNWWKTLTIILFILFIYVTYMLVSTITDQRNAENSLQIKSNQTGIITPPLVGQPAISEVKNAKIVYESGGSIFLLNGIDNNIDPQKIISDVGDGQIIIGISPDKKYAFFINSKQDSKKTVQVYNFETKEITTLGKVEKANTDYRFSLLWSQNNSYFLLTNKVYYGNAIGNSTNDIYTYPSFKKVFTFYSYDENNIGQSTFGTEANIIHPFLFLDDNRLVYLEPVEENNFFHTSSLSSKRQISYYDIASASKKILVSSLGESKKLFLMNVKDDAVYYSLFEDRFENNHSNLITDYYSIEAKGMMTTKKLTENDVKSLFIPEGPIVLSKIYLPPEFLGFNARTELIPYTDKNWIIFEMNYHNNLNPIIAIMNKTKPQATFKVIGVGYNPFW